MKKFLMLSLVGLLPLSACAPATLDVKAGPAVFVTNSDKGGLAEVVGGDKDLPNFAFRLDGALGLKIATAPEGTLCYSVNEATGIYCRVGTVGPKQRLGFTYTGRVSGGAFAYSSEDGGVTQGEIKLY